jgi:hypothetical protein
VLLPAVAFPSKVPAHALRTLGAPVSRYLPSARTADGHPGEPGH